MKDDPRLIKHVKFIASSNQPRQDIIDKVRERALENQGEEDIGRRKCTSEHRGEDASAKVVMQLDPKAVLAKAAPPNR